MKLGLAARIRFVFAYLFEYVSDTQFIANRLKTYYKLIEPQETN